MNSDDVKKPGSHKEIYPGFETEFMAEDAEVIEAKTIGAEMETIFVTGTDVSFSDYDPTNDEEFPAHVIASANPRSSGTMKKFMVPALALVLTAGAGAYIATNPQIIGGGDSIAHARAMDASYNASSERTASAAPVSINEDLTISHVPGSPDATEALSAITPAAGNEVDGAIQVAQNNTEQMPPPPSAPGDTVDISDPMSPMTPEPGSPQPTEVNVPVPDIGASIDKQIDQSKADEVTAAKAAAAASAPAPAVAGLPTGGNGQERGVSAAPADTVIAPSSVKPDSYYDGTAMPSGPMASQGPRKADPNLEPGSRFVIVKETHGENELEAVLTSANRALQLGMNDSALEMFDKLYSKNPRDPRILMGRAVAQQNSGLDDAAIHTYEELLEVAPNNADATVNMLGLIRKQYPEVALRRLMDLEDKNPTNAGIAAQIGVTQADLGHPEDALKYLGMASSLEPNNAQHVFNMAVIADRQGNASQAVKFYEQAMRVDSVYGKGRTVPRDTITSRLAVLRGRM